MNIAVVGIGYVGLAMAVLLSQRHHVTAVDIDAARVDKLGRRQAPIQDADIEAYLSGHELDLTATLDAAEAYRQADWVVISTPTNYDPHLNYFDTSSVESVIEEVLAVNPRAYMAVKSTVPVGFTQRMLEKHPGARLVFSPEFLREGHALSDNLHPSRIIVARRRSRSCGMRAKSLRRCSRKGRWTRTRLCSSCVPPRRRPSSSSPIPTWPCA